jgi:hypothetical protein
MTNILALAGRKQSGKNTAYNFLLGIVLLRLAVVRGSIEIKPDGRLWVSDIFGDEDQSGIARFVDDRSEKIDYFNHMYVYPFIRNYSFADLLKQSVCIDLLGLTWEQCYGTDEQKNSETHLIWEKMPVGPNCCFIQNKGPMTGRQVMQYVGTEIFRQMYNDVWAVGTVNRIIKDQSKFAVITDCRFPNEVEAVQKAGGRVIKFTRNPFPEDTHESETALDEENFDWNKFDFVLDNRDMTISDQNGALYKVLEEWGWFGGVLPPTDLVGVPNNEPTIEEKVL